MSASAIVSQVEALESAIEALQRQLAALREIAIASEAEALPKVVDADQEITIAEFCKEEGIAVCTFYEWAKNPGGIPRVRTYSPRRKRISRRDIERWRRAKVSRE